MEQKTKVLLCEDDENLGMLLREYLQAKGYDTELRTDGESGLRSFVENSYDICVLDVMMPKKDGLTLAKEIREVYPAIPIVFLTAKNLKDDVLLGFQVGADDYITKPFSMEELTLRMEAILRRVKGAKAAEPIVTQLGDYTFDSLKQTLAIGDEVWKLTTKENDLLALLTSYSNTVLERTFALKMIWNDDNYFNARSMDVYITKLRKLLKRDPRVEIMNIHGKGYKLVIPN